jgi:hypothetical protein
MYCSGKLGVAVAVEPGEGSFDRAITFQMGIAHLIRRGLRSPITTTLPKLHRMLERYRLIWRIEPATIRH